ncbi:MAG: hypothetical protein SP1CHLAM54_05870 [Chlamydiia bacterium]|nr:hypothetical protein [Chlamydiia bacterium]MCH9615497.1 hypothetical protein [Chlamydiia bacterium]MCH9629152.1 hypothetical protein [Chlamydiia bacterium]
MASVSWQNSTQAIHGEIAIELATPDLDTRVQAAWTSMQTLLESVGRTDDATVNANFLELAKQVTAFDKDSPEFHSLNSKFKQIGSAVLHPYFDAADKTAPVLKTAPVSTWRPADSDSDPADPVAIRAGISAMLDKHRDDSIDPTYFGAQIKVLRMEINRINPDSRDHKELTRELNRADKTVGAYIDARQLKAYYEAQALRK